MASSTSSAKRKSDRADHLDRLFGALSDRTRRALLQRLARAPATVGELAAPFAMSLPAISKHVRILEDVGLLRRTVNGRLHHCRLDATPLRDAAEWLEHYREFWDETLAALAAFVEADAPAHAPKGRR